MHQGIGTVLGLEKSIADNSFGSNLDIMNLELATILFSSCIIKRYEQKVKPVLSLKGQANVISRKHLKGNLCNSLAEVLLPGTVGDQGHSGKNRGRTVKSL